MSFAEKIHRMRLDRNLSLQEFADLLGTSKQVLSRYEHGERTPKITMVKQFADALNVPLEEFVDIEPVVGSIGGPAADPTMSEIEEILAGMTKEQLDMAASMLRIIKSGK